MIRVTRAGQESKSGDFVARGTQSRVNIQKAIPIGSLVFTGGSLWLITVHMYNSGLDQSREGAG